MCKDNENFVKIPEEEFILLKEQLKNQQEQINLLRNALFGRKSEKSRSSDIYNLAPGQLTIFDDNDEYDVTEIENSLQKEENLTKETSVPDKPKSKGRRKIAVNLPVEIRICTLPEEKQYDENGEKLVVIGHEKSEKLEYVPGHFIKIIYKRAVYGHKDSREYVKSAPLPYFIIDKGKYGNNLIHTLVYEKYYNGVPLYRQINSLNNQGGDLAKSTASDAVKYFAELYEPLWEAIKKQIFSNLYVHADESPLKFGKYKDKYKSGYIYVYQDKEQVYFHYGKSRSQSEIKNVLTPVLGKDKEFAGYLMCDGYSGYDVHKGKRLACWAHVRRYFFKLADKNKDAENILKLINLLYKVEKDIHREGQENSWSEENLMQKIAECRKTQSKEIIDKIIKCFHNYENSYTPQSAMGKAITYAKKRWPNLQIYLEDPILPIDNNAAERSLRSMVIGKKNFHFVGSEDAGKWSAICYTIMESCRLQKIDPRKYMEITTERLLIDRAYNKKPDYSFLTPLSIADKIRN